jgi:hypothetical protein
VAQLALIIQILGATVKEIIVLWIAKKMNLPSAVVGRSTPKTCADD